MFFDASFTDELALVLNWQDTMSVSLQYGIACSLEGT